MNKRKAKKARKKVVYPLVDEAPLLTMNEEEREKALEDFNQYVQRHYRYFHYKDKEKLLRKPCFYRFPYGESCMQAFIDIYKNARGKTSSNTFPASQSIPQDQLPFIATEK